MTAQILLNDIYNNLNAQSIVDTKKEFYETWLNRSNSYLRYLKHTHKQPSADALAICSSKLKYYSKLIKTKYPNKHNDLTNSFDNFANQIDNIIFSNSKAKWLKLLEHTNDTTIH
ncbi:DUF6626 family protein [Cypionkella sp.]|uniref:DUF6626 family protein n=1 Tax=Cypionkella sp. TaxID=2811411 RepID=UPI003750FDF0